jgi:hypothetical protein
MAGVAGPMLLDRRAAGVRFLAGLAVGGAAGGAALAVVAFLAASLLGVLDDALRLWLFVPVAVVLAVLDLTNRTPHVWRQVPQQLVNTLPPGTLGLVWGFDLGLLFTTQKVASLIWVALAGVILVEPTLVWVVLVGVAVIASLAVIAGSSREKTATWLMLMGRHRMTMFRRASGAAIAALAVAAAVQAWPH